ncbi:MAG TPA: dienelactone hydrolase family protein [Thermoanaerobaculia bacterium]|nr:dienelactone hydrolase family protein [Thermoanaerobaculia bacterium]
MRGRPAGGCHSGIGSEGQSGRGAGGAGGIAFRSSADTSPAGRDFRRRKSKARRLLRRAPESVHAFEAAMKGLGKNVEVHIYEDANHAFANASGGNYNPAAAKDAWGRTTAFLAKHLK